MRSMSAYRGVTRLGGQKRGGLVFCKGKSIDSAYNGLFQKEGRSMLFGDSKGNTKGMC